MIKLASIFVILLVTAASVVVGYNQKKTNEVVRFEETIPSLNRTVYIGAWVEDFWDNDTKKLNTQVVTQFEQKIDKKMALVNIYSEWSYLDDKALIKQLDEISSQGWVPIISANPFFFNDCPENGKSLYKTIADGDCDEFLRAASKNLASYNKPVLLRFAWEMNLPDMYWSVQQVNSTPQEFIGAWKRFYTIMEMESADNVEWILSFNTSHPNTIPYADLFPGDEYVDWVAIDGYNWGNTHEWSGWADFNGVFRNSYNELIAITDKPVMLSEVNSAPTGTGGNKAEWLRDMLSEQIIYNFPHVEAIVFFNENKTEGEKVDWRMEKSPKYISVLKEYLSLDIYKSTYP